MLHNRLVKRSRHLRKWARRTGTTAYRLYDRDIPEIPLVLDYYGGAVSMGLYKRPYEKEESAEQQWLRSMQNAAAQALAIDPSLIFVKTRDRQRGLAQYEKTEAPPVFRDIEEYGLHYRVNLSAYVDTGFFPDRRKLRELIRAEASGKRILNLFCYTGSFSVCAASGGAALTDSVDLSNTYLDWAKINFEKNGLNIGQNNLIREDVLVFLTEAVSAHCQWDMIILDPPAFSNSKKMTDTFDIQRDHAGIIRQCLSLLAPDGALYFSVNVRHFRLDTGALSGVQIIDITETLRDEDFTGKKIPGCYKIRPQILRAR
ncbi:hypothetical protein FACS1894151_08980 [Spirochaetia bacterium]|nr:hypothetical protein FACS1894151_08980 [Spirochaetia bacterium]